MNPTHPPKLKPGDTVMVIAPSDSLHFMSQEKRQIATSQLQSMGLNVVFANNVEEYNEFDSSSVSSRVSDLHQAFSDNTIQGIICAYGGYNSNQLLRYIDWNIIQNNPKVFIGYSDITGLQNAIFAKTGLVTYSGPNLFELSQKNYAEYTLKYFQKAVMSDKSYSLNPSKNWSDDTWYKDQEQRELILNEGWTVINNGEAKGRIIGGNLCTLNLLQGNEYFPDISHSILFLEDDGESNLGLFERDLQSLMHLPNFNTVKGLVIGRFQKESNVDDNLLVKMIRSKPELAHIPVVANVDFGHTFPMITFPIGGKVELKVREKESNIVLLCTQ